MKEETSEAVGTCIGCLLTPFIWFVASVLPLVVAFFVIAWICRACA